MTWINYQDSLQYVEANVQSKSRQPAIMKLAHW